MTDKNIKSATLEEIREMHKRGELLPDAPWADDVEENLPDAFWENAEWTPPVSSTSVHLKLDRDVFDYFKADGKGHITRMQNVLRAYVEAQKKRRRASQDAP